MFPKNGNNGCLLRHNIKRQKMGTSLNAPIEY